MGENNNPQFTTKRRALGSTDEYSWGGEAGEPWEDAIDTSENISIENGTASPSSNIPEGGVFRYDFEDEADTTQALDLWDNNTINLTLNGAGYSTNARWGSHALNFDGTNDTPSTDLFGSNITSHTVAAWVYLTDNTADRAVATLYDGGDRIFFVTSNGAVGWGGGTNAGFFQTSDGVVSQDAYEHLMFWYDHSTGERRIYVNNTQEASSTDTEAELNDAKHDVGHFDGSTVWQGQLDRVDFYNKPLNSTERSNLYNNGSI